MNLGISYSKSNRSSCRYCVRMRSCGERHSHIRETKHVHSVLHPHIISIWNTQCCLWYGNVSVIR